MQPIGGFHPQLSMPMRPTGLPAEPAGASESFQNVLFKALEGVNRLDSQSQAAVAEGLTGPQGLQSEAYIQMMQADLAFRTMLQIRNKLLDAYNEIKQMQV